NAVEQFAVANGARPLPVSPRAAT
ncbi:MAG: hypothetical protein JWR88_2100, partial [Pseudonocardia sp.]|nr:hypothetical protein [Pseudonocardia sp.]